MIRHFRLLSAAQKPVILRHLGEAGIRARIKVCTGSLRICLYDVANRDALVSILNGLGIRHGGGNLLTDTCFNQPHEIFISLAEPAAFAPGGSLAA